MTKEKQKNSQVSCMLGTPPLPPSSPPNLLPPFFPPTAAPCYWSTPCPSTDNLYLACESKEGIVSLLSLYRPPVHPPPVLSLPSAYHKSILSQNLIYPRPILSLPVLCLQAIIFSLFYREPIFSWSKSILFLLSGYFERWLADPNPDP